MVFAAFDDHTRTPLFYYEELAFCENLTLLTPDNIVPMFLHLVIVCSGLKEAAMNARFRTLSFEAIQQPPDECQDNDFNGMVPLVFLYLASLIPKNPTESLTRFLVNKEKGLIKSMRMFGVAPTDGNYLVPIVALEHLQSVINYHTDLLSFVFQIVIGYCNSNHRTFAYNYAMELIGQLEYSTMNGVMIIEHYYIGISHPSMLDPTMMVPLADFNAFKTNAIHRFTRWWTMIALLDKEVWLNYSRSPSFARLRIVASMFAADVNPDFGNLQISKKSISSYQIEVGYYGRLYSHFGPPAQGIHVRPTATFGSVLSKAIGNRVQAWENSTRLRPARAAAIRPSPRHYEDDSENEESET